MRIGAIGYYGDAPLTADGQIRLYVGDPYSNDGLIQQTRSGTSAQLVGTLDGRPELLVGHGGLPSRGWDAGRRAS